MKPNLILFLIVLSGIIFFPPDGKKSSSTERCIQTSEGLAIEWTQEIKLKWKDFAAKKKLSRGFGIASTYSDFEYERIKTKSKDYIEIYVRFYCDKSWHNKWFLMDDVLSHEQLHFDISELYGRIFHKEIVELKHQNKFSMHTVHKLYKKLQITCNDYQDLYDEETDHSTNGTMQRKWNQKIRDQLEELEGWADYTRIFFD